LGSPRRRRQGRHHQALHGAPRHFLSRFDYDGKDTEIVGQPDPLIVQRGIDAVGD